MTALVAEVTAKRHFSSHVECEEHKAKVHIKHNISFHALKHLPTHTHNLSATRSKCGPNPSGNTV